MEAANRWETEAIRESRDRRNARPTVSQQRTAPAPDGDWRTLREASDETGIPTGTLRKWCRRETVDSYLESDGEQTLRMLEMGSVRRNAKATGREMVGSYQLPATSYQPEGSSQPPAASRQPEPEPAPPADPVPSAQSSVPSAADDVGTMLVPVDAWNKMLNQLGNLHEAGQQLAKASERAAKAETEVKFLRERLGELRESYQPPATSRQPESEDSSSPSGGGAAEGGGGGQGVPINDTTNSTPVPPAEGRGDAERSDAGGQESHQPETTSFFRYVVRGWRGRKR